MHRYSLFISMQTTQPARKYCIRERHRKRGRATTGFLSLCSLSHFPWHELFNGFSHLCVWGNMICIHLTVTGTTWGQGTDGVVAHVQTSHYSACNNHTTPLLPVSCFHSWHAVRPQVASSFRLQYILLYNFKCICTSFFPNFILKSRSSIKGQMASLISVVLHKPFLMWEARKFPQAESSNILLHHLVSWLLSSLK